MLPVLFNDSIVFRRRSGIGHYAAQLLHHLAGVAPDVRVDRMSSVPAYRWVAPLMERSQEEGADLSGGLGNFFRTRLKTTAHVGLNRYLGWVSHRGSWGLLHEPDAIAPNTSLPVVATFCDLSVRLFPQWHPVPRVKKYERLLEKSVKRTQFFISISEATKRDLIHHLGVAEDSIAVTPLAPRPHFGRMDPGALAANRLRMGLPAQYFLFVGNLEPRKNLVGLLKAYSRLPSSLRTRYPLLLVGGWGWGSENLRAMLERPPWREDVKHLGYVSEEDLAVVMNGATALVYPSFYEGFGLPVIEAMACGTPVICSLAGGLEEVAADVALAVDPENESSIANKMRELAEDSGLQRQLSEKGLAHAALYSWQQTAEKTAAVYRRLLS